jgi:hypothetical protein
MPLSPTWKLAKTTFENTTKTKKPSDTWIGNVRKSTGIDQALKDIDGAKNAADLKKALTTLGTKATEYISLLDRTAKDPKAVPVGDKQVYLTALAKLKETLEDLKSEGEKLEEALEGAGKKDKVDPELLKAANEHIALRLKAAAEAPKMVTAMRVYLTEITQAALGAAKQLEAARKAAKESNTMLHQVAVGVIHKYIEQGEGIEANAIRDYKEQTSEKSLLMAARSDNGKVFDALPDSLKATLKQKRDAPFKAIGSATAELGSIMNEVKAKLVEIKTALSQAEAVGNQLKAPSVYISELTKLKGEVEKIAADASIKVDKIVKSKDAVAGMKTQAPDVQIKWYDLQIGQWERYQPDIKLAAEKLKSLGARLQLPKGALETKAVAELVDTIGKTVKEGMDFCQTGIIAGGQMVGAIQLQKQRLPTN